MSQNRQQALRGFRWSAIERISVQAVQFVIGLVLARQLTPDDFGLVGMLAIFMAVSQVIVDSGFANALIRRQSCSSSDYSTALICNVVISLGCYAILYLTAPLVATFYGAELLTDLLRVQALGLVFNSLTIVQVARLTRDLDFRTQTLIGLSAAILSGILGVWCAYHGVGVWSIVYQSLSCAVFNALFFWLFGPHGICLRFSRESFRALFGYGSRLLTAGILGSIYNHITTLVIGRCFLPSDLGYYTRGQQFASIPSTSINNILTRVTFPLFSRLQNDNARLIASYRQYICLSSIVIFFGLMLLSGIARPVVVTLLGDRWLDSAFYLQLFCFALLMDHICQINLTLLQVHGRSDLYLRLEIIKKVISFTILFASIPFGIVAVCCSRIVYSQIAVIINTYYTGRLFHVGYFAQVRDFGPYLLCAVIASLPCYWLSSLSGPVWLWGIAGIVLAVIIYAALLWRDTYFRSLLKLVFKSR